MIAFVARDSLGKDHLWVRPLDSPAPLLLSGTENAYYPFWSYDSRMIAYFADGKLKKIDAKGGPTFTICDATSGRGGTWNKDGVIVFAPNSGGPLYQVSSAGGTAKQLTVLDSTEFEVNHRWPCFLPDGNHFFYTVQTSKPSLEEDADHIRIASLNDAKNENRCPCVQQYCLQSGMGVVLQTEFSPGAAVRRRIRGSKGGADPDT